MPEERRQKRLGELLVERGIITQEQLNDALDEQKFTKRFLGETLVARKLVTEEEIAKVLSEQLGLVYVDIKEVTIEAKAIELIPEEIAVKYTAMPLFIVNDMLTVAMANPLDVTAIDEMQASSNLRIRPVFGCLSAIRSVIDKYYIRKEAPPPTQAENFPQAKMRPEVDEPMIEAQAKPPGMQGEEAVNSSAVRPIEQAAGGEAVPFAGEMKFSKEEDASLDQVTSLKEAASSSPVVDTVNNLIGKAVEMSVSDIHLEPQRNNLSCRYRIDGVLHAESNIPYESQAAIISRIKIMANLDIAEKRLPQDGRIKMSVAGKDIDLRISTFPTLYGENVVIRILDRSGGILRLKQLGFSDDVLEKFNELIKRPYGIILVTGPTGSGKTTTLYAALNEIDSVEKNIITVEDPIEYELENVRQSQVNVKAGLTFARGLRAIVRQDPDIIMVGEIRDKETADISIHAALTGHLVFSTLHTNDAPSAANRLIDMGMEPFLISSSVIGIMAQRLVRILCPSCKEEYSPPRDILERLGIHEKDIEASEQKGKKAVFYNPKGCRKCKQRGYIGRMAIYELLLPNDKIKEMISEKTSASVLREEAVKAGMKTLRTAGIEKVLSGLTSISEILRVTEEV